jgi:hypothetical protein
MSSINLNPGSFPRYPGQYPLIVDRTRTLTVSKCNIWRAMIKEATLDAAFYDRPMSILLTEEEKRNLYESR